MATTKCCSGGTCDGIVTIGYMREMANISPCTVVSDATPFSSSCCSAEESAYTPTYHEITNGKYALARVLDDNDPSYDVNGFSSYTQTLDSNCCPISVDDKVLPHSALTFGYTEITSVKLSATTIPSVCNRRYDIKQTDTFTRHTFGCSNDNIIEISSSTIAVTLPSKTISNELPKTYGDISDDGECEITVNGSGWTRTTSDSCGGSESDSISFPSSSYTASVKLDCSAKIPCESGNVIATIVDPCGDDVRVLGAWLNTQESITSGITGDTVIITIPRNSNNNTNTKLFLKIKIGSNEKDLTCDLDRSTCKLGPQPVSEVNCGVFPCEDNWSAWQDVVVVHPY